MTERARLPLEPALGVLIVSAIFLDVQLPVQQVNVGNLILVAGCALSAAWAMVLRMRAGILGVSVLSQDWVYAAYIVFALASMIWSPSPIHTIVQAIYLCAVWIAMVNLADGRVESAIRIVIWTALVVALLSFAVVPLSRTYAFQPSQSTAVPELRGIFSHQLRLGVFMATALGLLALAVLNRRLDAVVGTRARGAVVAAVLLVCLVAAFARLYTAAMVLALALTVGLAHPGWRRRVSLVGLTIAAVLVFVFRDVLLLTIVDSGVDITLTGRSILWERTLSHSLSHPWIGHGYASFDHPSFDALFGRYRPAHPHNSYLQAYFETGIIGLGLTLLLIVLQLRVAFRVSRVTGRYSYSLFLVLLTAIGSLTGSNYAGKPTLLLTLVLVFVALESREVRRIEAARVRAVPTSAES